MNVNLLTNKDVLELPCDVILEWLRLESDSRNTSIEVWFAINCVATSDDEADRIWEDPTESEIDEVERLAWSFVPASYVAALNLWWGTEKLESPNSTR